MKANLLCGLTLGQVTRLVFKWQTRLSLFEWTVTVKLVGAAEMGSDSFGRCDYDEHRHTAVISLSTDAHNETGDVEELIDTIVHELLHLQFWWVPRGSLQSDLLEQSLHRVCPLLAACKPAKVKKTSW